MAWTAGLALPLYASTCGGLRRPLIQGVGVISGTTKQGAGAGTAAPCRVYLFTTDGMPVGFRRTGAAGTYSFVGLAPGRYLVMIQDDQRDDWRPKVEMVTVPSPSFSGLRRLVRLLITAADDGLGAVTVMNIQFRETASAGPLALHWGDAFASSAYPGNPAANAFDSATNTLWASQDDPVGPHYIAAPMADVRVVNSVSITARPDYLGQSPRDFSVQTSHDGDTWVTEWSVTGSTGWTLGQTRVFNRP